MLTSLPRTVSNKKKKPTLPHVYASSKTQGSKSKQNMAKFIYLWEINLLIICNTLKAPWQI